VFITVKQLTESLFSINVTDKSMSICCHSNVYNYRNMCVQVACDNFDNKRSYDDDDEPAALLHGGTILSGDQGSVVALITSHWHHS